LRASLSWIKSGHESEEREENVSSAGACVRIV
jgi:hypothetical protein